MDKISHLNKALKDTIHDFAHEEFPKEFLFNQGMEFPQFKITIDKQDNDVFIDAKGQKWKRIKR